MLGGALGMAVLYLVAHTIMGVAAWQLLASVAPIDASERALEPTRESASLERSAGSKASRGPMRVELSGYNPFCPECAARPPTEAEPATPPPPGVTLLEPGERETELPLTLVATMEAVPPGRSFATIAHHGKVGLFGEGEVVVEGVELLEVDHGVVHLEVQDDVEFLRLPSEDRTKRGAKERPARSSSRPKSRRKSRYELPGAREAIDCRDTDCTVDRRFVEQLLASPALLARQGRAAPYARDGLRGFRLSRVRAGTIPRLLGLRSGDVVTAINGQPLSTLDAAMRLLTRLRRASHLSIEVVRNRRGQRKPVRLDIDIV